MPGTHRCHVRPRCRSLHWSPGLHHPAPRFNNTVLVRNDRAQSSHRRAVFDSLRDLFSRYVAYPFANCAIPDPTRSHAVASTQRLIARLDRPRPDIQYPINSTPSRICKYLRRAQIWYLHPRLRFHHYWDRYSEVFCQAERTSKRGEAVCV